MSIRKSILTIAICASGFAFLVTPTAAEQPTKIDFSSETVGAEPKALVAVVGLTFYLLSGRYVTAEDGFGRVEIEEARAAGIPIPITLLEQIVKPRV